MKIIIKFLKLRFPSLYCAISRMNFFRLLEANFLFKNIDFKKKHIVLDSACGTGRWTEKMSYYVDSVHGSDLSYDRIQKAKEVKGKKTFYYIANSEDLPFKNNIFDRVVSICAIEHFANPEKAFKENSRVLKHGGIMVFTVDVFSHPLINDVQKKHHRHKHHVQNYFSPDSLFKTIKKYGFNVENHQFLLTSSLAHYFAQYGMNNLDKITFKVLSWPLYYFIRNYELMFNNKRYGYILCIKARKS